MTRRSVGPDTHRRYGELPACRHCPAWDWTLLRVFDAPDADFAVFRCTGCDHVGIIRDPHDDVAREYRDAFEV
ncbi:hypothetical protein C2R22_06025 [Salinigranum rubrum]|uniref:Uncharacterized protein n=1 Tax=Salinigranum rubrum TaxID=755307 RepID=A0A2I8VH66_9EURY|nr:hypothetical protein [Salinigranum rubrum]AUV81276.1 hypothetical protein C2R22_06025 [Salinigranum rubrum]